MAQNCGKILSKNKENKKTNLQNRNNPLIMAINLQLEQLYLDDI
jgi:hypothetical protein